jgi:hypothetical protein
MTFEEAKRPRSSTVCLPAAVATTRCIACNVVDAHRQRLVSLADLRRRWSRIARCLQASMVMIVSRPQLGRTRTQNVEIRRIAAPRQIDREPSADKGICLTVINSAKACAVAFSEFLNPCVMLPAVRGPDAAVGCGDISPEGQLSLHHSDRLTQRRRLVRTFLT